MSLFIAELAFPGRQACRNAWLSVMAGSLLSAAGVALLWSTGRKRLRAATRQTEPFP